jgi:hypothetical protein
MAPEASARRAQVHGVVYHGVSREHLTHSAESAVPRRQQARLDVMQRTASQQAPPSRWRACDVAVLYCCTDADSPEVQEKLYCQCECVEAYATGDPMKCQMPYLSVRSVGMLRRHAPSMMQEDDTSCCFRYLPSSCPGWTVSTRLSLFTYYWPAVL